MRVCIYLSKMRVYFRTCIPIYRYVYTMYRYLRTCVHIYTYIYIYIYTCIYRRCACISEHVYPYIHIQIFMYTFIYTKNGPHLHTCHGSFMCVSWHIHVCVIVQTCACHDSSICVTWLIHMCDMTHSYVWHDWFICVTWLIYMCDMTYLYLCHDVCTGCAFSQLWIWLYEYENATHVLQWQLRYGVARVSRIDSVSFIGLFCKRNL